MEKNITTSLQDLINFITMCRKNKGHQKFNNNYKKVNKGKQNSISHSVKFVYKNYTYVPNFTSIRQKKNKAHQEVRKGQRSIYTVDQICRSELYLHTKFCICQLKNNQRSPKGQKYQKRSVSNFGQMCIHKYYIPTKFHSNQLINNKMTSTYLLFCYVWDTFGKFYLLGKLFIIANRGLLY